MDYVLHLLIQICVFALLSLGQYLILGRAGILLVTQVAMFAVGAYGTVIAASAGVPSSISLLIGTGAALVLGLLIGLPALRLQGDYLLVASLGFCEIVRSILNNWTWATGGAAGFMNIPTLEIGYLRIVGPSATAPLAIFSLTAGVLVIYLIGRSPFGSLLTAIGEDTDAVRGMGKAVSRAKLTAICVASVYAGFAGGIWAFYVKYLNPSSFTVWESVAILSMIIVGGSRRFEGALLGTALLIALPEVLRFAGLPVTIAESLRQILFGIMLILIMRFRPEGLLSHDSNWRAIS